MRMMEISFDVMQSAAIAALVAIVGRAVVKRVKFFQTYCIPGVVVAGLVVSFVLGILRGGTSFPVAYLPDEGDTLVTGMFLTESITQPTMAFSKAGVPYWHNFAFTLREVKPHD